MGKLKVVFCFREFELMFLNSSWIDPPNCQLTPETGCDLSFDLGSDSDYNFRVRAHCGSRKSAWTRSSSPFNRRESEMKARSKTEIKDRDQSISKAFTTIFLSGSVNHSAADEGDIRGGRPSGVLQSASAKRCCHGNGVEAWRGAAGDFSSPEFLFWFLHLG